MNTVPFDTAKFQENLVKAKFDPKQAKAQSDVLFEALTQNIDKLATKEHVDVRFDAVEKHITDELNNQAKTVKMYLGANEIVMNQNADNINQKLSTFGESMKKDLLTETGRLHALSMQWGLGLMAVMISGFSIVITLVK